MAMPAPIRRPAGARPGGGNLQDLVIVAMRSEIQEHGALLTLFDEQQRAILGRDAARVMALVEAVQKQVDAVQNARARREALMAQAVARARIARDTPLMEIMKRFSPAVQPLMQALVEELMRISDQVRRKANQNQILLARSIEVIRDLLEELSPRGVAKVYENDGRVKITLSGTGAAYKT
jgi:flagellar biosynthesis/type III secretory pathway chaperone